jgi:hypothetical protein
MSKPENKIGRYYKFAEFAKRDGPMWAVNYPEIPDNSNDETWVLTWGKFAT